LALPAGAPPNFDPRQVAALDQVIARGQIPQALTLYRGRARRMSLAEARSEVGTVIIDHGYVSTSLAPAVAESFAGWQHSYTFGVNQEITNRRVQAGTLYQITIPAGSRGAFVDAQQTGRAEYEIVLPRGSQFLLTGVSQRPIAGLPLGAYTVLHLELLPPEPAP